MGNQKWWTSLTLWAGVVCGLLGVASDLVTAIGGDTAAKIGPTLAAALVVFGRFRATGPLAIK